MKYTEQRIDQLAEIINANMQRFYDDLQAADCQADEYTTGYINLMGAALETISENTNPRIAMELVVQLLQTFCDNKDGITLMTHVQDKPAKGQMS